MNEQRASSPGSDHFRSLQILDELSHNDSLTQRDLSSRLGIALGLVNSYIKNLIAKGYITVKTIPSKRYAYYLTPKGFAEKTRLTYNLLHDYTRIYREARTNLKKLFQELRDAGCRRIAFAGADEVAEIAYLSLQEAGLELVAIVDDDAAGRNFFGTPVKKVESLPEIGYDIVLISTYLKRHELYKQLLDLGVDRSLIRISLDGADEVLDSLTQIKA